ncbi:MAG: tetratricopeptide repeat protein [Rhodospirillales bacterium]
MTPDEALLVLEQGLAHHHSGKLDEAKKLYQQILDADPANADALHLLGVVRFQSDRVEDAVELITRAVKRRPKNPQFLNNLGEACRALGKLGEAAKYYKRAIKNDPGHAGALKNLAKVYADQGKFDEAEDCYRRALANNPGDGEILVNLGDVLKNRGKLNNAAECFNRALAVNAGDVGALNNLANVLSMQDKPDEAIACFKRVIEIVPGDGAVHNNLGALYQDQGDAENAMASYERALELNPDAEDVLSNMAILKKEAGEHNAAETLCRRILEINPEGAETYYNLSRVKKFIPGDADIKAMEKFRVRLDRGSEKAREKIMYLDYSLGKAYGDIGEHDREFEVIAGANRLKRDMLDYDVADDEKRVDRIMDVFDRKFFDSHKDQGFEDATPIFIIGMPRSGTTLVEQILASHSNVHGAGELNFLANVIRDFTAEKKWTDAISGFSAEQFRGLGEAYMANLSPLAPGVPRITDKMPRNFFFAGIIALSLPGARIIHCRRDAMDTCLSNFEHLFPGGQKFTYDQGELGRYYVLYARLMDHWRAVLGGQIFDLDYEALIAEPEPVMRKMLEFCGLGWQDACLDFHKTKRAVRTASAAQVRQPLYASAIKRWKKYEKHLGPLLDALGPLADRDWGPLADKD